jgi:hypothetical protein
VYLVFDYNNLLYYPLTPNNGGSEQQVRHEFSVAYSNSTLIQDEHLCHGIKQVDTLNLLHSGGQAFSGIARE